ncbi:uncharacterized protein LOC118348044 [Juglans regia]|uniref:Uncharacterized protein LOC118348044 n=1 Tax=Juglans regia TaxID=51240 RepID=A0A6P9EBH1_JUGRE|nr:uncharacterized protein LOC118348044 [Juglans regia]
MTLLCWNSRGLGNPRGVRVLVALVKEEDPKVLFLQETRLHEKAMERLKYGLGFDNCLAVSSVRRSGIAIYWKKEINVVIKNFLRSHIHASIIDTNAEGEPWFITGVYGQPEAHRRHKTWDLIRSLKMPRDKRWLLMGDFNKVFSSHEKSGGKDNTDKHMQDFRAVVDECELLDLGFQDISFTWCNKREADQCISERFDRCLPNLKWKALVPMANVIHGNVAYSDHVLIKLQLQNDSFQRRGKGYLVLRQCGWWIKVVKWLLRMHGWVVLEKEHWRG